MQSAAGAGAGGRGGGRGGRRRIGTPRMAAAAAMPARAGASADAIFNLGGGVQRRRGVDAVDSTCFILFWILV